MTGSTISRRILLLALPFLPSTLQAKKKNKKKKTILIKNFAGEAWVLPINQAIASIEAMYPELQFRITTKKKKADVKIYLVPPEELNNPLALAEGELGGSKIWMSTKAKPTQVLVCHELSHIFGNDHGPWVNMRPCPFIK